MEETLDSFLLDEDKISPVVQGNLVRASWSKLKTVPSGTQAKRKRTAKSGNSLSKKVKGPKSSTAANAPPASAEGQVPAAVEQGGGATGDGAQAQAPDQAQDQAPTGGQVPDPAAPSPDGIKLPSHTSPV